MSDTEDEVKNASSTPPQPTGSWTTGLMVDADGSVMPDGVSLRNNEVGGDREITSSCVLGRPVWMWEKCVQEEVILVARE